MKYLFTTLATLCCILFIGTIPTATVNSPLTIEADTDPAPTAQQNEKREARIARRAARQAQYERFLDSVIVSHNYRFIPTSMQVEPAGSPHMINNALSELAVYTDYADINLPYLRGIMPPYRLVIINNVITNLNNYTAIQTDDGWTITFSSWLYSANNYDFKLNIYSKSGSAQLYISSTFYSTVSYWGSIMAIY